MNLRDLLAEIEALRERVRTLENRPRNLPGDGGGYTRPFVVLVTKDGGVAGDASTECSYTYTVKKLNDSTELGTEVTPEAPRLHYVAYWYAGETRTGATGDTTSRYGLACYASGSLVLLYAFGEIPKEDACP